MSFYRDGFDIKWLSHHPPLLFFVLGIFVLRWWIQVSCLANNCVSMYRGTLENFLNEFVLTFPAAARMSCSSYSNWETGNKSPYNYFFVECYDQDLFKSELESNDNEGETPHSLELKKWCLKTRYTLLSYRYNK